jgi:hypothetical protein
MSTQKQPSEHAMRAAEIIWDSPEPYYQGMAQLIQSHAIEPATRELREALNKAIELCHVPEHNQDTEWREELERIIAVLAKHEGSAT